MRKGGKVGADVRRSRQDTRRAVGDAVRTVRQFAPIPWEGTDHVLTAGDRWDVSTPNMWKQQVDRLGRQVERFGPLRATVQDLLIRGEIRNGEASKVERAILKRRRRALQLSYGATLGPGGELVWRRK